MHEDTVGGQGAALARQIQDVESTLQEAFMGVPVITPAFAEAVRAALDADPALDARHAELETKKAQIVEVLRRIERGKFKVVGLLKDIQRDELFRAEYNDKAGRFYQSFSEYLPDLLDEWRLTGVVPASSVRQVREYLRIDNLFVQQLGLTEQEVLDLGVTHFTHIAEGLAYDHATGEILDEEAVELPPGKYGKTQALALVDQIREGGPAWTVSATAATVDDVRGIVRTNVVPYWRRTPAGRYVLSNLVVYDAAGGTAALTDGLTEEQAEQVSKRLGAPFKADD